MSAILNKDIGFGNSPISDSHPHKGEIALALKYHKVKSDSDCVKAMHSGSDAPGAFGWLAPDDSITDKCAVRITANGEATRQPGKPSKSGCELEAGDTIMLPIHASVEGKTYDIAGFAAFYVTAIDGLNGDGVKDDSIGKDYPGDAAKAECVNESVNKKGCIFGWFLDDYVDFTGTIDPGGAYYGVTVVQPLG
jgi:hypothetical protein